MGQREKGNTRQREKEVVQFNLVQPSDQNPVKWHISSNTTSMKINPRIILIKP